MKNGQLSVGGGQWAVGSGQFAAAVVSSKGTKLAQPLPSVTTDN
jgi:hypothetical protein